MSGLQECKGNGFFEVGQAGNNIWLGPENLEFLNGPLPLPDSTSDHEKFGGGEFNVLRPQTSHTKQICKEQT